MTLFNILKTIFLFVTLGPMGAIEKMKPGAGQQQAFEGGATEDEEAAVQVREALLWDLPQSHSGIKPLDEDD